MVISRFELVKQLDEKELLKPCLKMGLLPINTLRNYEMVKRYIELKEQGEKTISSFYQLSAEFELSFSSIERIVRGDFTP